MRARHKGEKMRGASESPAYPTICHKPIRISWNGNVEPVNVAAQLVNFAKEFRNSGIFIQMVQPCELSGVDFSENEGMPTLSFTGPAGPNIWGFFPSYGLA